MTANHRVTLDFEGDLTSVILDHVPFQSFSDRQAFEELKTSLMLMRFLTWRARFIPPRPRRVLRANGFEARPLYIANRTNVNQLLAKIAAGQDVNGHLSRLITNSFRAPVVPRKLGPDLDLLLNEWGIHHLHISHTAADSEFMSRSRELLFAVVRSDKFYALAVLGHGTDFAAKDLVRAAVTTWPSDNLFLDIHGVSSLERSMSDEERIKIRKGGVNTLIEVDGRFYGAAGGISSAGTPMRILRRADEMMELIRAFQQQPSGLVTSLRKNAKQKQALWPRRPDIRLALVNYDGDEEFGFIESKTGADVRVDGGRLAIHK